MPYMYIWMQQPMTRERALRVATSWRLLRSQPLQMATRKLTRYISWSSHVRESRGRTWRKVKDVGDIGRWQVDQVEERV